MATQTHKHSKIVYLKRLPIILHESNKSLSEDYFALANRGIGSAFANGSIRPVTGLTISEENLLMPYILNIPKEDRDFRQKVTDYFHDINTKVAGSESGTPLETGLEYGEDKSLSEDGVELTNPPINIQQYIAYRQAVAHPAVAPSLAQGKGNPTKMYYIHDTASYMSNKVTTSNIKDNAFEVYLEVKHDVKKVDMYLTLMGVNAQKLDSLDEKVLKLRDLIEKRPKDFLVLYKDKNNELAYFVDQCVNNGVFKLVGTRILVTESAEELGRDKEQTVLFLKDTKNAKQYAVFKAHLRDKLKKAGKLEEDEETNTDELDAQP